MVQAVDQQGISTDDVWYGLVWLVESLSSLVIDPSHPARVDAAPEDIIDAVLKKLERDPGLRRTYRRHSPSVRQAMECAIIRKDAVEARKDDVPTYGPIGGKEATLLGYAAWHIADLNDATSGVPHLTARLMSDALDQMEQGTQG